MRRIFASLFVAATALVVFPMNTAMAIESLDLRVADFKGRTIRGNELRESQVKVEMVFDTEVRRSKYINFTGSYAGLSIKGSCEERSNYWDHTRNPHRVLLCSTYFPLEGVMEHYSINIILDDVSNAGTLFAVAGFDRVGWDEINFYNLP